MNAELQSTNEGLEASKEELRSLNEGLTTLNSQLEGKVRELEEANNDLSNLLVSTDIATLFLDRRLHIRRYTPAVTRLMGLRPCDVGRAMTGITRRFEDAALLDDVRKVLAGLPVEQQEIRGEDGQWYLRRLLPYQTDEEPLAGVVITFTEITRRKEAECALAESERALRRITDAMPALISYIDTDERYRFINAAYQRWFGVGADAIAGQAVADVIGAEAYEVVGPRIKQALGGEPVEYEAWVSYQAAGTRYVHAEYIPDRRSNGEVAGICVLVADITERRRNEETIEQLHAERRAQLAEMQTLFEAAPIGIFVGRDVDCHSMVMNRAGAQMLRLSSEANPSLSGPDAPALPFRVFRDGRELDADELPMQRAVRHGETIEEFEEEIHFEDGEVKTLMTYAAPLRDADGTVRGCVGTFADVTATREAERHYRETLERLKLHLDNTPVAACEWAADFRILRWSPAAERMFGWTADEALGSSVEGLGLIYEGDREHVRGLMRALVAGTVERNRNLNRNCRKDGEVIWCSWYNSVLRDERGDLVSVLSLAMDVTDRQNLEEGLRRQAEQLADADRRKDEFLSMLGHELRNPLAPLRNAVAFLALKGDDPEGVEWARQVIDRQTQHLERLVDDLLDVARITRGAIDLKLDRLDLCAIVREAVTATEPIVRERTHHLTVDLPERPLIVSGDPTRLVQVLTNLINNAAKYTPPDGQLRLAVAQRDEVVSVTVEDNGQGITPEQMPYIFDVFTQGKSSLTRTDGGLGLGLALVKRLVEMHGGTVRAESAGVGQGSRFTVTLPIANPAAGAEAVPTASTTPLWPAADNPKRILVVDDNEDVLESSKLILEVLGHEVWGVSSGRQVVDKVKEVRPHVVVLDIGLQDIDGIEVARRLAELPERPAMKVIAFSGYGDRVAGAESGLFDGHLLKGVGLDKLTQFLD